MIGVDPCSPTICLYVPDEVQSQWAAACSETRVEQGLEQEVWGWWEASSTVSLSH